MLAGFGCFAPFFGFPSHAQSGTPQLDFNRDIGFCQGLTIGVADGKRYIVHTLFVHILNCIASASAYTDYFDDVL